MNAYSIYPLIHSFTDHSHSINQPTPVTHYSHLTNITNLLTFEVFGAGERLLRVEQRVERRGLAGHTL